MLKTLKAELYKLLHSRFIWVVAVAQLARTGVMIYDGDGGYVGFGSAVYSYKYSYYDNGRSYTDTKKVTLPVSLVPSDDYPLPAWVSGTFYGKVHVRGDDGDWEWPNAFEVMVSETGVVTAKIIDAEDVGAAPMRLNASRLVRYDDDCYGFTFEFKDNREHSSGECTITRIDITDGVCIGMLGGTEYGIDPDEDEYTSEFSGYQNMYDRNTGLAMPAFESLDNKLYIPLDDYRGLTLTFGANGAVSVVATTRQGAVIRGVKGTAAHLLPYSLDGETVTARLYVMTYEDSEDEALGLELDLSIPVSASGEAKASEVVYKILDSIKGE